MRTESAGITRANDGLDGIRWNILGQIYVPKHLTEHSFSWHATFPPDTFVPPHIHPTQDEYLYILEGRFEFVLDGRDEAAAPGDLVRLPMGVPQDLQPVRRAREMPVLGLADAQAVRPVLGDPHHAGPDARQGRRALGRARGELPAASGRSGRIASMRGTGRP
jgi:hypothetical protein